MLRILFIGVIVLVVGFFFLEERVKPSAGEKPVFLRVDTITGNHQTNIFITSHSMYTPTDNEYDVLRTDYSNIWAHLNYLYATNNVLAGKEYYTEDWFKQICNHYELPQQPIIKRTDEKHELHIQNWASDALVCTAIDSNVIFKYQYPDNTEKFTKANIAVILLQQGDHWRIDAIRIIDETVLAQEEHTVHR
jgi:hypothetical protein